MSTRSLQSNRRRWLLFGLLVVTSPLWLWYGIAYGVALFLPVKATISNNSAEAIVSAQYTAFGRQHALGRIEPGKSRTILVWAFSDRSATSVAVKLSSGKVMHESSSLYAPWGTQDGWTVEADNVRSDVWSKDSPRPPLPAETKAAF